MGRYLKIFLLLGALTMLFWYSAKFQENFYKLVEFLQTQAAARPITAVLAFTGFAAVSAMFSPFSSVPLVPPVLLIWGPELTLLLLLLGWLLGGMATYLAGFYGINPVLRKFVDMKGRIAHYQKKLSRRAEFWLVMLFRLAMPAEIPGYVLGSVRYNFVWYFIATLISEIVFAVATIYGSAAIIEKQTGVLVLLGLFMLAFFTGTFYLFSRAMRARRSRSESQI